jgi:crotonobetainyl-CoA:carnitine CoA-transferase CaiB-like acyl-CoA transferase
MLLTGVRVLDFGRYIAGPYCAALLADLGADVIRVDKPGGSEDRFICPVTDQGEGALFLHVNRNKRGMTLDPATSQGRVIVRKLLASTHIVVANMPEAGLKAIGLDYETLKSIRPDIILAAQNAFGATGPYASRSGFDGVAQAMSGATYLSGLPGAPMKSSASWADFGTALFAAFGTMAAILHRERTGEGQRVEAALLRTALGIFHFNNMEQYLTGCDRQATGNRSPFGGPADLFKTQDGWIQVQVIGAGLFRRWCQMIGEDQFLTDPRFQSDHLRSVNGQVLSDRTQEWAATRTTEEALVALQAAKIPAGPLLSPTTVFDDPHIRDSGMLTPMNYQGLPRPAPMMGCPVQLSALDTGMRRPPPTIGEHTEEILGSLGYDAQEIENLRAAHVI